VVKLYADEDGSQQVRNAGRFVVSAVTRVEVVAAIWRKVVMRQLSEPDAAVLVREFEADWSGTADAAPLFTAVQVTSGLLDAAAALVPRHGLQAYDAVVLAAVLAVRSLEPDVGLLVWDADLAAAGLREGLTIAPVPGAAT
jgi:predicted nucleic acid-binding protein